jgi:hypothetical protein
MRIKDAPWNNLEGEGFEQDFVGTFAVGFDIVRTLTHVELGIHLGFWTFSLPLWRQGEGSSADDGS